MNSQKKKLDNLIKHSVSAFQTNNNVHMDARKSAEALCKLIILKYHGEENGTKVLYKQYNQSKQNKLHAKELYLLIQASITSPILRACYKEDYKDDELSDITENTLTYIKSILLALNNRGNSSAHDNSHIRYYYSETTQYLLREVLEWLFQDFLKVEIPSELTCHIGTYDIFLSYSQEDEVWVETLKKNLVNHGYKIFIDNSQLIAGENRKKSLRNAIKRSRNAIVVYPKQNNSLWIKNELEWIEERKDEDSSFKSIPIVLHDSSNLPHENLNHINFINQEYRKAFNQLLCSLKRVPPSEDHIEHKLELPKNPSQFVNEVMQDLEREKVVILFSQEFSDIRGYYNPIEKKLRKKFKEHFYRLSIPTFKKKKKYFHAIAEQCGIEEEVENFHTWKTAMQEKLSFGEEILLLITDLDNGKEECNLKFASTLRDLSQLNDNLYVVLVGRKELAELVFQGAIVSPLHNIGKYLFFPYNNTPIVYEKIELILSYPLITKHKAYLLNSLEKSQIKRFTPWSDYELLNYLFWKGILTDKEGYYVWRSEELREMIREILNLGEQ